MSMDKNNLDWESVEKVNDLLDDTPIPEPSSNMDDRFYGMLENETERQTDKQTERQTDKQILWFRSNWRVAAGIILFVSGWLGGSLLQSGGGSKTEFAELSNEVIGLKETLVLTMMDQSSSVDRIRAVNLVSELPRVDDQIIKSLTTTLNNDPNDNVRLASLDALVEYADNPEVREELILAISKQSSPLVLLRLAEVMSALQEKRAASEFKELLNDARLNYSLRSKLNETIQILT